MASWKIFWFFSQNCASDALLQCYWYWKQYNFIVCVLWIAGIKALNNRRLLTNSTFSHTATIFNYAQGCWLSWKLAALWRSLMTVLWSLCQKDSPHQATRPPQPSILQEVNGSSPVHAGAGGGKPLWSEVMCTDWNFSVVYISIAAAKVLCCRYESCP